MPIYNDGNSFVNMAQSLTGRIYYYVLLIYLFIQHKNGSAPGITGILLLYYVVCNINCRLRHWGMKMKY